jgi:hypothetical protein
MATTTNYGWTTPDDTALVKDGAAAIRTLGTSVDTTTKALNPSTTLGDIEYRSSTANTNTRLGIGSTGQILTVAGGVPSWATPAGGSFSGVSLKNSASQTISTATNTFITYDTEDYDTNGFHDNVTNNDRITIPVGKAGKYLVTFTMNFQFTSTTTALTGAIIKNASTIAASATIATPSSSGGVASVVTVLNLAEADYVRGRCRQDTGGDLSFISNVASGSLTATYLGA